MDSQRAITAAAALGGRVFEMDSATNDWVVLIDLENGRLVCIDNDEVVEFAIRTDFPDGEPISRITISPRVTGLLFG